MPKGFLKAFQTDLTDSWSLKSFCRVLKNSAKLKEAKPPNVSHTLGRQHLRLTLRKKAAKQHLLFLLWKALGLWLISNLCKHMLFKPLCHQRLLKTPQKVTQKVACVQKKCGFWIWSIFACHYLFKSDFSELHLGLLGAFKTKTTSTVKTMATSKTCWRTLLAALQTTMGKMIHHFTNNLAFSQLPLRPEAKTFQIKQVSKPRGTRDFLCGNKSWNPEALGTFKSKQILKPRSLASTVTSVFHSKSSKNWVTCQGYF